MPRERWPSGTLAGVESLPCGHIAYAGSSRMCAHLVDPAARTVDYVRLLTGHGMRYDMCCTACDPAMREGQPPELLVACEGCVARFTEDGYGTCTAWRGEPGIERRPEPTDPTVV